MPGLKSILQQQAAIPANIEASMPILPKMSGVLVQMASAVPIDLQLPDLPMGMGAAPPMATGFTQVIKGIEDAMPVGVPKLSQSLQILGTGGYRPEVAAPAEVKNNQVKRVMGDGYRSI